MIIVGLTLVMLLIILVPICVYITLTGQWVSFLKSLNQNKVVNSIATGVVLVVSAILVILGVKKPKGGNSGKIIESVNDGNSRLNDNTKNFVNKSRNS